MIIETTVKDDLGLYAEELQAFREGVESIGGTLRPKPYPRAAVELAGPACAITVAVDPETLRLIFQYAVALVAIYKSTTYCGAFFEAAVKKLGEMAGAQLVEVFGRLWRCVCERVKQVNAQGRATRVYLSFEFDVDGVKVEVNNSVFPTHLSTLSESDVEQAFNILVFRVIPVLIEFSRHTRAQGLALDKASAVLRYSQPPEPWYWDIRISALGEFRLSADGVLRTYQVSGFKWKPWTRRRLLRKGIAQADIETVVREYVRAK